MKAFVPCAGFGLRMGELTAHRPKPLLPVEGVPLIYYSLFQLQRWGVREVAINLHYRGDDIRRELGGVRGLELYFSEEPEILGTAGGARKILDGFLDAEERFVILNPDAPLAPAPGDHPDRIVADYPDADAWLYLSRRAADSRETGVRLDPTPSPVGVPTGRARLDESGAWFYIGYGVLRVAPLRALEPDQKIEFGPLWRAAGADGRLQGREFQGARFDAGTRAEYERICTSRIIPEAILSEWREFLSQCGKL